MAKDVFPFVSIIVVNYNGKHHLKDNLASLGELNYPKDNFEVILVDNGSKDGSVEYVRNSFPWVKVLRLDKNYGFCKPNNEGAKIAKGTYLVFLNNDTVVDKNWLQELVKGIQGESNVLCCASKILYYDRRNIINAAGGKITQIGGGFYRGYGERDCGKYNGFTYTGFGCAAGVLIDKNFFISIGGFDEDYFASCEEHELGLRVWMYGYKVLYVPTAIMYHKESGTFGTKGSFQPMKVYLITRNRLYNMVKNFELSNVMRGMIAGAIFDTYRSAKYLIAGNFTSIRSTLRAYLDFAKNLQKMFKKRSFVQNRRNRSDKELYKLNVIATFKESIIEEKRLSRVLKGSFYKS
jgi:GT2 family glycosyltransferase